MASSVHVFDLRWLLTFAFVHCGGCYFSFIRMVEYIENEAIRKKADKEAQRAKLETLERQLGIDATATEGAGSSSSASTAPVAGKKHRFDDTEYLEQSRDIVDGVKNAVAAGTCWCLDTP